MKLRIVLLFAGTILLFAGFAGTVVGAEAPPVQVRAGIVPVANGTKDCEEARAFLAGFNRGATALNRQIAAEAARKRANKAELVRLVGLAQQLQANIRAATAAANKACKKAGDDTKKAKEPPANQDGRLNANPATPPADNGTAACQTTIKQIKYLNSELEKSVRSHNLQWAKKSDNELVQRAHKVGLEQIKRHIARLRADLQHAVARAKEECSAQAGFAAKFAGAYEGNGEIVQWKANDPRVQSLVGTTGKVAFSISATGAISGGATGSVSLAGAGTITILNPLGWGGTSTGKITLTAGAGGAASAGGTTSGTLNGRLTQTNEPFSMTATVTFRASRTG